MCGRKRGSMAELNWKEYFNNKAKTHKGSVMTSDYYNEKSFYIQRENILGWLGVQKGKVILDGGCGVGAFSENLAKENEVHGIDFSEESLEYASKRGINTHFGNLTSVPFEDGKFDVCYSIGVIQYIHDYKNALKELARVVKPGGTLLIETLNEESLQRKAYCLFNKGKDFDLMFSKKQLSDVFVELGFKDIEFLTLYQPFYFKTTEKAPGFFDRRFGITFAIKGIKM